MITIIKSENREQLAEVIQGMFLDISPVISWELSKDGKRTIIPVKISNVDNDNDTLLFTLTNGSSDKFNENIVYFFSDAQKVIFKTKMENFDENGLLVTIPDELKKLEDTEQKEYSAMIDAFNSEIAQFSSSGLDLSLDDGLDLGPASGGSKTADHLVMTGENLTEHISTRMVQTIATDSFDTDVNFDSNPAPIDTTWITKSMSEHDAQLFETELSYITLDEEDKIYEGMRETPRAKPPEGKMITVQINDESRPQSTHNLYDLSQGGLSFLVFAKEEFSVGESLLIKAFDTSKFESPMLAEVKAIREADDMGIQYKVGCQFVEATQEEA